MICSLLAFYQADCRPIPKVVSIYRPFCYAIHQLLPLKHDHQSHDSKHHGLQPGILAQQDCYISNHGNVPTNTAHNVLFAVKVILATSIQLRVVCQIVVTLHRRHLRQPLSLWGVERVLGVKYLCQEHMGAWCRVSEYSCQHPWLVPAHRYESC